MLIRPQQALPLARNNSQLLIFNNIFKIQGKQASLRDLYEGKEDNPYILFLFQIFSMPSFFTRYRGSKLALLHRVKERKTPSLSAQASFAPFSLKVAWSGKYFIVSLWGVNTLHQASFLCQPVENSFVILQQRAWRVIFCHSSFIQNKDSGIVNIQNIEYQMCQMSVQLIDVMF